MLAIVPKPSQKIVPTGSATFGREGGVQEWPDRARGWQSQRPVPATTEISANNASGRTATLRQKKSADREVALTLKAVNLLCDYSPAINCASPFLGHSAA